ncbi:1004_t:CDS:2, partial [Cetraspora pellucida]
DTLKELVILLCPFAEASTYLGASKTSMIGFINPILVILSKIYMMKIEYEDVEEHEISKHHKININVPQNCDNLGRKVQNSPADNYLLHTLLDPHHKKLEFADSLDHKFVMNTLKNIYNKYTQDSQQTLLTNLTDIVEPYNLDNELSTKCLKKKFCSLSQNNEVENYFQLNEIDLESDACTWWATHKNNFPVLASFVHEYLA